MTTTANTGDELIIRISQLSNGLHEYHFSSDPSIVGLHGNFKARVVVDAVLDKTPHEIFLRAAARTSGSFTCDRCTENFEQAVSNEFTVYYVYRELEDGRYPPEEVQVISPDTTYIDLAEDVRQMVLLSIPLKLLCKTDCKGLCPHCGSDLNAGPCSCTKQEIDPRWEGLAKILKN